MHQSPALRTAIMSSSCGVAQKRHFTERAHRLSAAAIGCAASRMSVVRIKSVHVCRNCPPFVAFFSKKYVRYGAQQSLDAFMLTQLISDDDIHSLCPLPPGVRASRTGAPAGRSRWSLTCSQCFVLSMRTALRQQAHVAARQDA